jgi:CspA family cold shock protein
MGRYKEYREPRRRGYDDDATSSDRPAARNRSSYPRSDAPQAPRSNAPQGGAAADAVVKWFNAEKGFGFVAVDGGAEAFLHIRQLQTAGHTSVPEGARLKVMVGQGQKGPEVTQVLEVDTSTAAASPSSQERRRPPANPPQVSGQTREGLGTVKMYKADKGFGFISQDDGGKDVFVHATTLARVGLKALSEGQRVRMQVGQGKKGLEAQSVELLD